MTKSKDGSIKVIIQNKKARFDYEILETFEAGLALKGFEVKSIREGEISLSESYVRPIGDELFLINAHVKPYSHSAEKEYDPIRKRKLLLHRHEINKLKGRVEMKGLTVVPLRLYLKGGRVKLEIGLARGRAAPDKRKLLRDREVTRDMERAIRVKK